MPTTPSRTAFRLPRTAYLVVVFLLIGVTPFALGSGVGSTGRSGEVSFGPLVLLFLIPVLAAAFIARTGTVVDDDGITVRALFGSRVMPWGRIRGISVEGSTVYAVQDDGSVRLPCIALRNLSALAEAAGDHLPQLRSPAYKQPPGQRRRR